MTIQLINACFINGSLAAAGSQHTLDEATEAGLIYQGMATRVGSAPDQGGAYDIAYLNATGAVVDLAGVVLIRPVVSYAWADRPAAASNTGVTIRITDVGGSSGSRWISDGAYWKPESGRVVLGGYGEGITAPADTLENSLQSFVLPAYSLGVNGLLSIVTTWSYTNNANNKVLRIRFGTMGGERLVESTQSTTASLRMWTEWQNRNRTDQQAGGTAQSNSLLAGGIAGAAFTSTQDTTVDKTIFITGQKASAGDSLILMRWVAELIVP